jgi:hypothetical protein
MKSRERVPYMRVRSAVAVSRRDGEECAEAYERHWGRGVTRIKVG